jgi:hypothetical protein
MPTAWDGVGPFAQCVPFVTAQVWSLTGSSAARVRRGVLYSRRRVLLPASSVSEIQRGLLVAGPRLVPAGVNSLLALWAVCGYRMYARTSRRHIRTAVCGHSLHSSSYTVYIRVSSCGCRTCLIVATQCKAGFSWRGPAPGLSPGPRP